MANEKLVILKMLEEGKITAEEASRLLEASGPTARPSGPPPTGTTGHSARASEAPRSNGQYSAGTYNSGDSGAYSSPRSGGLEDFAGDLGRRFESFARDMEPKFQKFGEVVVEKTANFADRISKSIDDHINSDTRSSSAPYGGAGGDFEKRFELNVSSGYNELSLAAHNGNLLVHGYNGDKITASVQIQSAHGNPPIELMRLGNRYFLNYDSDNFKKVTVDAYIPENLFNIINLSTVNGNVDISTLSADNISVNNMNGNVKLQSLNAKFLKAESTNANMTVNYLHADNAQIENVNGPIQTLDLDCANLMLSSVNGSITINMSQFESFSEYVWNVESSNAKVALNLPTSPGLGYHLKGHASLGKIHVGLTNMNYIVNSSTMTEAKSINFDSCPKKVKLALETSNAALQIN
ncbi:MAG: DUF4097 family beta strand repeat-containing protein [Clostridiales bacterium]|jgi:hypothetical protein|nr:DUF4097 family beta strand repeat-containing protein [Clostridiales bacterium]